MSSRERQSGPLMQSHGSEGGFQALLRDAGLWDLVQMRCEARSRCVIRVGSHGRSGYLYFTDGQIVHATLGTTQGESAALEILSWSRGSWDPCERAWPGRHSITATWQALLLRAAQREDEARQQPAEREDDARQQRDAPLVVVNADAAQAQDGEATMPQRTSAPPGRAEGSGASYRPDDFEHAVRLDVQGNVLSGHGRVEELAALSAYACRLGDLIGELMGMGKLHALEAALHEAKCLIFRGQSGTMVALRPRANVDLTRIRAQLRL